MKFKIKKNSLKAIIASLFFTTSLNVLALTSDTDKPLDIDSEKQELDIQGNLATFSGNVLVTQGSIKITADKVLVSRPIGDSKKTIVDAYGNPTTFYQMQDNGKPVQGHADKLRYELANDVLELTGNAYIEQLDSNIKSDHLTYLVKKQKMLAYSQDQSKHVTTVLVPAQLQDQTESSNSTHKKAK